MRPIFVRNSRVPAFFSWFFPVRGITLGPFVFTRGEGDPLIDNHEAIHVAQYAELYIVGFLALYVWDFFVGLVRHRSAKRAYRAIRFEQEARYGQADLRYLERRPRNAWALYDVRRG